MRRVARVGGFTIVELLVAVTVLAIGVLAVASGVMFSTRNLNRSRLATQASIQGVSKLDELFSYANATSPLCLSPNFTSSVTPQVSNNVSLTWTVPATGGLRTVRVFATYRLAVTGQRTDTLTAMVVC